MPGATIPKLTKRFDYTDGTVTYVGDAACGSLDSDPVWRIQRLTLVSGNVTMQEWADGDGNFDQAWADRASASYS